MVSCKPTVLELLLTQLKDDTINFRKRDKTTKSQRKFELKAELQSLICEPDNVKNNIAIHDKTVELETIEEEDRKGKLIKKENFNLLDNEKPTKAFMNMENAKSGYSEITKLTVPNPTFNPEIPKTPNKSKTFAITNGDLIIQKMKSTFQEIFKLQQNLKSSENDLINFMNRDNDTAPFETLCRKNSQDRMH